MLRFWLYGAIVSTAVVNALFLTRSGCIGECTSTSAGNQYLSHQQCDKYCVCISGEPQVFQCKLSNHWSREHEICTHPMEAKCRAWSDTTIPTNALAQGCKMECPPDKSTLLAHNDCEKYCSCSDNSVTVVTCPEGHFSVKSNSCVPEEDAGCVVNNNKGNITQRSVASTTTSIVTDNECIGLCPELEDPSHIVYLAHRNCSKYCHCKQSNPVITTCLNNLLFSSNDMRCRQPKDVDCNRVNVTTTSTVVDPLFDRAIKKGCLTRCPKYDAWIPHKNNSKICFCKDRKVVIFKCREPYHFSRSTCVCKKNYQVINLTSSSIVSVFLPATTAQVSSSTLLPLSTELVPSSTEPPLPSTTGIKEEFIDCMETCPGSDSIYYDFYRSVPHKQCNKYCLCFKGEITKVVECPAGYKFDELLRVCDLSTFAECYNNDKITSSTPLLTPSATLSSTTESLLTTTESLLPLRIRIAEEFIDCVETCPGSDSIYYDLDRRVSHKRCNKYCECYKGKITKIVECSAGYNYDNFLQICSPYLKCDNSDEPTSSPTLSLLSSEELFEILESLNNDHNCLENCAESGFKNDDTVVNLPHKQCNKYCECHRGKVTVKECPLTYQFDWIYRKCIVSENASCLNYTISITTSPPLLSSSSEGPLVASSLDDTDNCIEACPSASSVNYNEYIKIPHNNCKKYCECYRGTLTVKECLGDSYYDCYFQTCDKLKYAVCYNQYSTSETSTPPDPSAALPEITKNCIGKCSTISKLNYAIFLKHKQCQKFCECFKGRLTVKTCPPNSYFNSNLGLCDQEKYVKCQDTDKTSELPLTTLIDVYDCLGDCVANDVYLIPHKNCFKYCECDLGYLQVKSCPSGTYFNSFTKRCEDTEFDGNTEIAETSITILSEDVEGCAKECPYLADDTLVDLIPHKQCEKYCFCGSWKKPFVMSCGPNSHFNPILKKCDSVENAECKGITNMNNSIAPRIIPVPPEDCPDCHDKGEFRTVLLKISGIKNGSEIDLKIRNPDDARSTVNEDDDDYDDDDRQLNIEKMHAILDKKIPEDIFPTDPNGLVSILANLNDEAQCIGECPQLCFDSLTVYLKNKNCRRACKCTSQGPRVMECHNNYYWNPITEQCDPDIFPGCTEEKESLEDEPEDNLLFDDFRKFMGW